jgi:hypothetical protein
MVCDKAQSMLTCAVCAVLPCPSYSPFLAQVLGFLLIFGGAILGGFGGFYGRPVAVLVPGLALIYLGLAFLVQSAN